MSHTGQLTHRQEARRRIGLYLQELRRQAPRFLKRLSRKQLRIYLLDRSPFEPTDGRVYRVYGEEVRIRLGMRPPRRRYRDRLPDSPGQRQMFDGE